MTAGSAVTGVEGNDARTDAGDVAPTPDMNAGPNDFTATINWGDGTSDDGSVDGSAGSFTVTGEHVYPEVGSYTITVAIADKRTRATTTLSATVTDAALTLTGGLKVGAIAGQFSTLTLGAFSDGNPNATFGDYTATIDWGDGSTPSPVSLTAAVNGLYRVTGAHTYATTGNYTAAIALADADGTTASASSTVVVGNLFAGVPSTMTLATFHDIDSSTTSGDFTATVNWGDGNTSIGTITKASDVFTITAGHTYATDSLDETGGVYHISVAVADTDGSSLTFTPSVEVVRPGHFAFCC